MSALGQNHDPADLPHIGERARLRRIVERFPHFWIAAGAEGIVTEATENLIALRMDEHIPGAEEWDNELCWTADDGALYAGSERQRIAGAFYADAEIMDRNQETAEQRQRREAGRNSSRARGRPPRA